MTLNFRLWAIALFLTVPFAFWMGKNQQDSLASQKGPDGKFGVSASRPRSYVLDSKELIRMIDFLKACRVDSGIYVWPENQFPESYDFGDFSEPTCLIFREDCKEQLADLFGRLCDMKVKKSGLYVAVENAEGDDTLAYIYNVIYSGGIEISGDTFYVPVKVEEWCTTADFVKPTGILGIEFFTRPGELKYSLKYGYELVFSEKNLFASPGLYPENDHFSFGDLISILNKEYKAGPNPSDWRSTDKNHRIASYEFQDRRFPGKTLLLVPFEHPEEDIPLDSTILKVQKDTLPVNHLEN